MLQMPKQKIIKFIIFQGPWCWKQDPNAKKRTLMLKNSTDAKIQGCRGWVPYYCSGTPMLKKGTLMLKKQPCGFIYIDRGLTEQRLNLVHDRGLGSSHEQGATQCYQAFLVFTFALRLCWDKPHKCSHEVLSQCYQTKRMHVSQQAIVNWFGTGLSELAKHDHRMHVLSLSLSLSVCLSLCLCLSLSVSLSLSLSAIHSCHNKGQQQAHPPVEDWY